LTAARLFELIDTVVSLEDVEGRGKPAPDLFLECARRLGITAEGCVVFEDSNEGIEAVHRARMRVIDVRLYYP
jgi:HAD superfamily hydrolase (TIGR01509 family)